MPCMTTSRTHARFGMPALAGIVLFTLTCLMVQVLRGDLDWVDVPLSFYLLGAWGMELRVAYVVMAVSLVVLAAGLYRSLSPSARSAAPLLLFAVAAVALCVVAVAETNTWAHPNTLHGFVHGTAARTTFLCLTVAMLLQACRMRLDVYWRPWARPAFLGALTCFTGLWVQALWRDLPRGLSQKVLVLMILLWLAAMAWKLAMQASGTAVPDEKRRVGEGA